MVLPAKTADKVSRIPMDISISALWDTYMTSEGTEICYSISGELTEKFNNAATDGFQTKYAFFSSKSELYRIISTVRNKILDWALFLEENGIEGKELTFTDNEKKIASDTKITQLSHQHNCGKRLIFQVKQLHKSVP